MAETFKATFMNRDVTCARARTTIYNITVKRQEDISTMHITLRYNFNIKNYFLFSVNLGTFCIFGIFFGIILLAFGVCFAVAIGLSHRAAFSPERPCSTSSLDCTGWRLKNPFSFV